MINTNYTYDKECRVYKSVAQIEMESKLNNGKYNYLDYDKPLDFSASTKVDISDNEYIVAKQRLAALDNEFTDFYFELTDNGVNEEITNTIVNTFNGKALYTLSILSGAKINFNKLSQQLLANKNNVNEQYKIIEQLYGQLTVGAINGVYKDYFTTVRKIYGTFGGHGNTKDSMILLEQYKVLMGNVAIGINPNARSQLQIIDTLKNIDSELQRNTTINQSHESVKDARKAIESYTRAFNKNDFARKA